MLHVKMEMWVVTSFVRKFMTAWFKNGSHSHNSLLVGFKDNLKQEVVTMQLQSPGGLGFSPLNEDDNKDDKW